MQKEELKLFKNIVLAAAYGDAIGLPYLSAPRGTFTCKGMVKCFDDSIYKVATGTWSNKASLLMCSYDAIKEATEKINPVTLNPEKINKKLLAEKLQENMTEWKDNGKFSPVTPPFRIDEYMIAYYNGVKKTDTHGDFLILLTPLAFLDLPKEVLLDYIIAIAGDMYNAPENIVAGLFYVKFLSELIKGIGCHTAYLNVLYDFDKRLEIEDMNLIWEKKIQGCKPSLITADSSSISVLYSSLWALMNTVDLENAIYKAVELGGDSTLNGALTAIMGYAIYRKFKMQEIIRLKNTGTVNSFFSAIEKQEKKLLEPEKTAKKKIIKMPEKKKETAENRDVKKTDKKNDKKFSLPFFGKKKIIPGGLAGRSVQEIPYTEKGIRAMFVADTHAVLTDPDAEILRRGEYDVVFLLGDCTTSLADILRCVPEDIEIYGVLGNHDEWGHYAGTRVNHIENTVQKISVAGKIISVAGVDGSIRYKKAPGYCMYSQEEYRQILGDMASADICIGHARPAGEKDTPDGIGNVNAHTGINAIRDYLEKYNIPLYIYGHIHFPEEKVLQNGTKSICVYGIKILQL